MVNISKEQAVQRAGRAGREAPGKCYRLYSSTDYAQLADSTTPEILRTNLSAAVLDLVKLGMKKFKTLRVLDRPDPRQLESAAEELCRLGAIERKGAKGRVMSITDAGTKYCKFPVEPTHARILIAAVEEFRCLDEALTVVAFLSSDSVFHSPQAESSNTEDGESVGGGGQQQEYRQFHSPEGDHVRMVKIYRAYCTVRGGKKPVEQGQAAGDNGSREATKVTGFGDLNFLKLILRTF